MARAPLRVAFDATPLLGVRTGVAEFCAGALGGLGRRDDLEVRAFAVTWRRRGQLPATLPTGVGSGQRAMPARPLHWLWARVPGPGVEWFIGPADVVHGGNYVVPPTRRAARVVTVHDLTAVRFPAIVDPAARAFPDLVRRAVRTGAWVHTPSKFVADEVVAEFGADPARVRAVHHGVPATPAPGTGPLPGWPALPPGTDRYLLAVGTVEPRKDYPGLLAAFDEVAADLGDLALVVAGPDGWGTDAFAAALAATAHRRRVVRLGYVPDERLGPLLAGAAAVAYPSVYEGFGLVPLQAMAAGVPVVTTAAGAIPEVVGEAAVLVPPGDPAALAAGLRRVLDDADAAAALVAAGRRRLTSFTWEACAAGLADLYRAAAG